MLYCCNAAFFLLVSAVSLPKALSSAQCCNLTFGPSLVTTWSWLVQQTCGLAVWKYTVPSVNIVVFCFIWFSVPSVLWHCWLGHLICKNPSPYDLYCVGGTLNITQSLNQKNTKQKTLQIVKYCLWRNGPPVNMTSSTSLLTSHALVRVLLCYGTLEIVSVIIIIIVTHLRRRMHARWRAYYIFWPLSELTSKRH